MPTARSTSLAVFLLALMALVASLACGKSKTSAAQAQEPARAISVETLPAETRVILDARLPLVMGSPVLRRLADQALARDSDARARLDSLLARCKIDPARDVEHLTVAMAEPADVALLVSGKLDQPALLSCVRAEAGELTESRHGTHTVWATTRDSQRVWLTFDGTTVIAATSEKWMDAVLDPARPKLDTRPDTQALLGRVDRAAAMWGIGYLPAGAGAKLGELTAGKVAQAPASVSFAVDLAKPAPLGLALRLDMASASDAAALADVLQKQLDLLAIAAQRHGMGRLVSKTQIGVDGVGVKLALQLDDQDMRLLAEAMSPKEEIKEQGR